MNYKGIKYPCGSNLCIETIKNHERTVDTVINNKSKNKFHRYPPIIIFKVGCIFPRITLSDIKYIDLAELKRRAR